MRRGRRRREKKKKKKKKKKSFLFLDLDDVYEHAHIPENVPYVLSGLDTLNPLLIIDDNLKLIGKYEETVGTCYIFSETGESAISSAYALILTIVKPLGGLNKVLKFRMATEEEFQPPAARKKDTH
ncbi:unnamed protein product [Spirodela intermedia]|uniref:Transcription factor TFIIIC triple barrel domain-containing protein n=1 Tax=Spirodela intermedia TaxID=51605 RepID=A0A7I8JIM6_SPIIN|nr:unnamed protein product [Spirodela intermedia]CAA6669989.1 unnamed protein product [Spirodela intermedia]